MPDYTDHAVNDLIKYVWDGLVAANVLDSADYGTLVPFAPLQDLPQFANVFGEAPYLVYVVTSLPADNPTEWWRMRDEVTFTIFTPDVDKAEEIKNWMIERLRKFDESARVLNNHSGISGKFNFHTVYFMSAMPADEARSEDGRVQIEASFCIEYVRYLDSTGNYL